MFGDYLDPLGDEFHLVLVDQRSQGLSDRAPVETWTLERMAADVGELAEAMGFDRYATLGHSYGAFVVLQQAVDAARPCGGDDRLERRAVRALPRRGRGEPRRLRAGRAARAGDAVVGARADRADRRGVRGAAARPAAVPLRRPARPADRRVRAPHRRAGVRARRPAPLRHRRLRRRSRSRTGSATSRSPCSCSSGRHDRTCVVAAGEAIAAGIDGAELLVFESSGHMTYAEENEAYLGAVRRFLQSVP